MFEIFTENARIVMAATNEQCQQFGYGHIETEHILLGLLKQQGCTGAIILNELGVNYEKLLAELAHLPKSGSDKDGMKKPTSLGARNVIDYAVKQAKAFGHDYIGSEHILLGLLLETDGIAAKALTNLGVKIEDVWKRVKEKEHITLKSRFRL